MPTTAGKVFSLVKPRMAGLWHTVFTPTIMPIVLQSLRKVYDGPVVQTQDLTVFNVNSDAVIVRQAHVSPQAQPIAGAPTIEPTVGQRPVDPVWWAEALLPIDDVVGL